MSDAVITVGNLGKKFMIGHQPEGDLRGSFTSKFRRLLGRSDVRSQEEFWALKDVSFEIEQGEAVGIIGRNGAGKSTLLKILSRITHPTTGYFEINGRVSSLLEVGTGFHSELTGRENIYLNGTILGMRRAEIKKKFNEIIDFSGVEKFLDTPVKHYSSGMKVRLAFSVAAHLEPEILIIDEVLAVGDAEFQKRCLGKMDEVSKNEGRTVLFVSHNMGAVENLCTRGILLSAGEIEIAGSTQKVIQQYLEGTREGIFDLASLPSTGSKQLVFDSIEFLSESRYLPFSNGQIQLSFLSDLEVRIRLRPLKNTKDKVYVAITVKDMFGHKLITLDNLYIDAPFYMNDDAFITASCCMDEVSVNPGVYVMDLWCSNGFETYQKIENALQIEVLGRDAFGTGKVHHSSKHGFFYQKHKWKQIH
jgi:lipopolysaccharide transport system ATP-binding protein